MGNSISHDYMALVPPSLNEYILNGVIMFLFNVFLLNRLTIKSNKYVTEVGRKTFTPLNFIMLLLTVSFNILI